MNGSLFHQISHQQRYFGYRSCRSVDAGCSVTKILTRHDLERDLWVSRGTVTTMLNQS